jgi:uncharacterized membrane protein
MIKMVAVSIQYILGILFIFLIGLFMPYLTRKEIVFGVRVPSLMRKGEEIKRVLKAYTRNYLSSAGLVTLILVALFIKAPGRGVNAFGIVALIVLLLGNYLICHKALKRAKSEGRWMEGYQETSVMDIGFPNRQTLVSPWWFCLPLGLILFQILLVFHRYDSLPDRILFPLHHDMNGRFDQWVPKSYSALLIPTAMSMLFTTFLFFIYKAIGWSKQQLTVENPEESKTRIRMFRRRWSGFIVFCNVIFLLPISLGLLQLTGILDTGSGLPYIVSVIAIVAIISGRFGLSLFTGQGGSRIKLKGESGLQECKIDRDDDNYWKLGMIYFNPQDPIIFLERRYGIGWTINFGNIKAVLILIGILIALIAGLAIINHL